MIDNILPIPAFSDNYIWALTDRAQGVAAVVDPGDATPVIDYLDREGLNLDAILITHHHPDHTAGLPELTSRYEPIVFGPHNPRIKDITQPMSEGDSLQMLGVQFSVFEVPGHTLDHIAFFARSEAPPVLFCGDTLFAAGCGRLFEGTPDMMYQSLCKLGSLPGQTRVYCTHEYTLANLRFAQAVDPDCEPLRARLNSDAQLRLEGLPTLPSTIALELKTNPFLRCSEPQLKAAAETHSGRTCGRSVDVFAAIRQWKDEF